MSSTSRSARPPSGHGAYVRTVTVGRRTLRVSVRRGTDPSVPALLLMNGIGASLEVLQPFVDQLSPRRSVIRFDVPGVGGSPRPVVPYNLTTFSPVVAGMLTRLGFDDPVDVLGLSWGGGLAQHFAFQHRSQCRRLVLTATATGALMVPANPRVLARMLTPRRHRDPAYARSIAGEIYGGTMRTDPERAPPAPPPHTPPGPRRGDSYHPAARPRWGSPPLPHLLK